MTKKHTCTCEKYSHTRGESKSMISVSGQKPDCFAFARNDAVLLTRKSAFTLAETLIALAIIGIVAALTIPNLMYNYQQRVMKEQVRTAKYKLTQATNLMNTKGLITAYPTTKDFVDVLSQHLKLIKVCDNNNLRDCWPTDKITVPNSTNGTADGTFKTVDVKDLTTGTSISSLGLGTKDTLTMGIVTADGVPMILTYSPYCTPLDQYTIYPYSLQDGKPVTNATTNCISAIFDVNGSKGPNRIGTDVRTLNSLFGYAKFGVTSITKSECEKLGKDLVNDCYYDNDYYAGAVKKCNDMHMHLPDMQTLANIAGAYYGRTDIGPYTTIYSNYYKDYDWGYRATEGNLIHYDADSIPSAANSSHPEYAAGASISGYFWASSEVSASVAYKRNINSSYSNWGRSNRNDNNAPFCVGD